MRTCLRAKFALLTFPDIFRVEIRGYGAAGSAPAWHAGGQGFKSP